MSLEKMACKSISGLLEPFFNQFSIFKILFASTQELIQIDAIPFDPVLKVLPTHAQLPGCRRNIPLVVAQGLADRCPLHFPQVRFLAYLSRLGLS